MPVEKRCEQCLTLFKVKPSHAHQRFCSRTCKTMHEAEHGRPAAHAEITTFACKVCGAPFEYKPAYLREYRKKFGKDPMYCSTTCGGIGRRLPDENWNVTCVQCGNRMPVQRKPGGTVNRQKSLCSTECRSLFRRLSYRKNNPNQEITRRKGRWGYVRLIVPGIGTEPSRDVLEHRYVMEQRIGRTLLPEETVHHVNGIKTDNAAENLELFSSRHGPGQRVIDKVQFAIEILTLYPEFAKAAGYELRHISDAPHEPA